MPTTTPISRSPTTHFACLLAPGLPKTWPKTLDAEIGNLRAALDWSIAEDESPASLRLIAGLWRYWHVRGQLAEGLGEARRVLDHEVIGDPDLIGSALAGGAGLVGRSATASSRRRTRDGRSNVDEPSVAISAENVLGLVAPTTKAT